jgi:hypothetical protein
MQRRLNSKPILEPPNRCGLDVPQRVNLFHRQGERCFLCYDNLEFNTSYVDHDYSHKDCHGSGCPQCVRGLAHPECHTAISMLDDIPDRIRLVADNLEQAIKETRARWAS